MMPSEVTWRTHKIGFSAPEKKWALNFSDDYKQRMMANPKCARLFNMDQIRTLADKEPHHKAVINFLFLEEFMCQFDVSLEEL